jgi:5-amino-6-(5-phosphoribosylamino)uracil reductase
VIAGRRNWRLLLSNDADFDRVDAERAASDAILVGANTIRRDNPRLLVRSEARRADRARRSLTTSPAKATVTASGELSRDSQFFSAGGTNIARLVYCPASAAAGLDDQLDGSPGVEVINTGQRTGLAAVLADLASRGVGRLLAEGGSRCRTPVRAVMSADPACRDAADLINLCHPADGTPGRSPGAASAASLLPAPFARCHAA